MPAVASKLPNVGTTIFTVMSQLASEHGAINLSQGFPAFEPPEALLDRYEYHLRHGANQYAPMPGLPALNKIISDKVERLSGWRPDPTHEVSVCTGATEGVFAALTALIRPGDEVIVFDPAYDAYEPAIALAGGRAVHVPLALDGHDFLLDMSRLADALSDRTRVIVLNFPHNPTGALLSDADLDALAALLEGRHTLIVADEVYEHLVFDDRAMCSVLSHTELRERSIAVSSFGKTLHATGWKVGYAVAPSELTREFRKVRQFTTFAVNTPAQAAIADFLAAEPDFVDRFNAFYESLRDDFVAMLETTGLRFSPTRSTFFQVVDYSALSDAADVDVARDWTTSLGVATIPLSVFCETPFTGQRLRLCFAKDRDTLATAAERIATLRQTST